MDESPEPDAIKDILEDALVCLGNANFRLDAWRQKRFSEFVHEVVLCEKVSYQISTVSQTISMQRLKVNMAIAKLTGSLSANKPRIVSPKDHTGGSSHFVDTTVPLTTVEVEGNGNGNIAQDLTCNPPKGPDKQDPSSNMTPRPGRADHPFPGLKMLKPPPPTLFVQNCKQIKLDT